LEQNRAAYMEQVNSLPQPVSRRWFLRLNWRNNIGKLRFSTLTIAVLLIFSILGSGVITVSAAQGSLPGEQLYPLKTWVEDVRLALTFNATQKLELHLEFAANRLEEVAALEDLGLPHSTDQIAEDFSRHIQDASQLIATGDDHGYADELEDLLSQYENLDDEEFEDLEEDPEDEQSEFPDDESLDGEETAEPDDEDMESGDEEDTEDQSGTAEDADEDEGSTETDEDQQPTGTPEETEEPDEDPEETDEPDETEEPDETDEPDDDY
jgi:hypothetical protein